MASQRIHRGWITVGLSPCLSRIPCAGKTTLLDVIAGRKTQGIIEVRGAGASLIVGWLNCVACVGQCHGAAGRSPSSRRGLLLLAAQQRQALVTHRAPFVPFRTQGEILLNGHPKEEGTWKRVSAYVEQVGQTAGLLASVVLAYSLPVTY